LRTVLTMPLVSRKGILTIAAVVDVAVNPRNGLVSAKALAARVLSRAGTASARAKRHPY
jgi:hypothetical protein